MRAEALLQALRFPALHPCASPAAQQACSLLVTFFNVSPDPKTPRGWGGGGMCAPRCSGPAGRRKDGCFVGRGTRRTLVSYQQAPLSPVLLARDGNNSLDLQEGDKQKVSVSVFKAPPREVGGFCCTFLCVPFLNPLQHPLGMTC